MRKNMTVPDRSVRALLVAPIAILAGILVGPGSVWSLVLYVLAAVMLATSGVGYCPLYSGLRRHGSGGEPQPH